MAKPGIMAFRWLGSLWTTPQQPAAPSLVPSTSPLARLSRTEQRDQLLDQLAELDAELAADEEYVPQKRPRFTQPEEEEEAAELFDEPPAEPRRRPPTNWDKVPKDRTITVDGNSIDDPAVKSVLKKQFSKDNAGYTPYEYWPSKTNAVRVKVKCLLHKGGCPNRCRIDFANGKATIRVGDHDHEHPDHDSDKLLNRKNLSESSSKCYCCKVNFEPGEIFISKLRPRVGHRKERFHLPCLFESFLSVQDGVESNYRNRFTGLSG